MKALHLKGLAQYTVKVIGGRGMLILLCLWNIFNSPMFIACQVKRTFFHELKINYSLSFLYTGNDILYDNFMNVFKTFLKFHQI